MGTLLAELSFIEILGVNTTISIREYITKKNPALSTQERARIFADAVNRILDARIPGFSDEQGSLLKIYLLGDAVKKKEFSIYGSDILKSSLMIRDSGAAFITALDKWLEETLESPLGRDRVEKLVKRAHSLMEQNPEMEIDGLVELAEETALMPFGDSEPEDLMEYIIVPPSMKPTVMPRFIPAVIPDTIHETQLIKPSRFLGSKTKFIEAIKSAMSDPRARRAGFTAAAGLFAITVSLIYSSVMNVDAIKETNPGNTSVFPSTTSINAVVGVPQADTGAWVAADDLVTFTDKNFDIKAAKRVLIKLKATAYDLSYASCGKNRGDPQYGITYSGTRAEAGRTIAVDPAVIPLGTTVRLTFPEKYGYMDGLYIAEDTGRLIKGNHIDVFFGEDEEGSSLINQKALRFGVQYVTAEIVK